MQQQKDTHQYQLEKQVSCWQSEKGSGADPGTEEQEGLKAKLEELTSTNLELVTKLKVDQEGSQAIHRKKNKNLALPGFEEEEQEEAGERVHNPPRLQSLSGSVALLNTV